MEASERRRALRHSQEHMVTFSILSQAEIPQKKKIARTLTKNISLEGAMIHSDVFLPVGEMLTLDLFLNGYSEAVTVVGQVRWVKNMFGDELFAVGLEFVDIPPGGRMALSAKLTVN